MLGVIGDIVQDVVVWLEEDIRPATDTKSKITMARGGSAANVAAFAARRYPTRFIGRIGDDLGGYVIAEEMGKRGVDLKLQKGSEPTGMIVVLIDHEGERMMFPSRGASGAIEAVDDVWLEDLQILHITGYSLDTEPSATSILEAARKVRERGGKISFDVSSVGMIDFFGVDRFKEILVDVLKPEIISANEDESEYLDLAHGDEPGELLNQLPNVTLVARAGAEPTRVFQGGKLVAKVPVIPAEHVRDLTGAGDSFNAAYLVAVLEGKDQVEACEAGHALARKVIGFPGASDGT